MKIIISDQVSGKPGQAPTFFQTTIQFRPTLLAQREDACTKGQTRRAQIYDNLITSLDTTEAS